MMKLFFRLLAVLALLALAYWGWTVFFPNPQKVIRQRLEKVAKLASFGANEGNVSRAISVQKLGIYFADDIHISVEIPGGESFTFTHRAELMQAAMGARGSAKSVDAKLYDIVVTLGADNQSATAETTAVATIGGEKGSLVQKLKFTFKKISGSWLITRVDAMRMPGD